MKSAERNMPAIASELKFERAKRMTGREEFRGLKGAPGFNVLGFWQWAASDLLSNTMRGVLAEYLVARALGIDGKSVREEWAPYDLKLSMAGKTITIEVKSASRLQRWAQKRLSPIVFNVPKTRRWDAERGEYDDDESRRQAQVYVFAALMEEDKSKVNPMDVGQWRFWVLRTEVLDRALGSKRTVTCEGLSRFGAVEAEYDGIREAVEGMFRQGEVGRSS